MTKARPPKSQGTDTVSSAIGGTGMSGTKLRGAASDERGSKSLDASPASARKTPKGKSPRRARTVQTLGRRPPLLRDRSAGYFQALSIDDRLAKGIAVPPFEFVLALAYVEQGGALLGQRAFKESQVALGNIFGVAIDMLIEGETLAEVSDYILTGLGFAARQGAGKSPFEQFRDLILNELRIGAVLWMKKNEGLSQNRAVTAVAADFEGRLGKEDAIRHAIMKFNRDVKKDDPVLRDEFERALVERFIQTFKSSSGLGR